MPNYLLILLGIAIVIISFAWNYYKIPSIKRLIKIFDASDIVFLEVSTLLGLKKIALKKSCSAKQQTEVATEQQLEPEQPKKQIETIKSIMVGTFHVNFETEEKPLATINAIVQKDDVVCIIVALHNATQIKTEFSGRITQILLKDGDPVEYGQPLMRIELDQ